MIKPTIGRVVLVLRPDAIDKSQPEPAFVCYVHSDTCINVAGFNANGTPFSATSVTLLQDDSPVPGSGTYAEWMPFQKEQAAKYEALEKQVAAS
jgi:hypothetical protein